MKKERVFDKNQLGLDLYNIWKSHLDKFIGSPRIRDEVSLDRDKNKIHLIYGRHNYVMSIEDPLLKKSIADFSVGFPNTREDSVTKIESALDYISGKNLSSFHEELKGILSANNVFPLSNDEIKRYNKVFGDQRLVEFNTFSFKDETHKGIIIHTPVLDIPIGKHGGLSTNLFEYFQKVIVKPSDTVITNL